MTQDYPFNVFCRELFARDTKYWSQRVGCDETAMTKWCLRMASPTEDDLIRIHFCVTEAEDVESKQKERWGNILAMPVQQAVYVQPLLQIEGVPEPNDPTITVAMIIESTLWDKLVEKSRGIRPDHRLRFLKRCIEHAETLAHYHKNV